MPAVVSKTAMVPEVRMFLSEDLEAWEIQLVMMGCMRAIHGSFHQAMREVACADFLLEWPARTVPCRDAPVTASVK